jgi:hypothetical protein
MHGFGGICHVCGVTNLGISRLNFLMMMFDSSQHHFCSSVGGHGFHGCCPTNVMKLSYSDVKKSCETLGVNKEVA